MKEVRAGRYAGPFDSPPYCSFVQSPLGLVPKSGNRTRLIFHLSYDFPRSGNKSVNFWTPQDLCTVQYNDLDVAILNSLKLLSLHGDSSTIYYAKTDLMNAFRLVPVLPSQRFLSVMKAFHPISGVGFYFVDKNLAFSHSLSCHLFQHFSDSLRHIVGTITRHPTCTVIFFCRLWRRNVMDW